MMKRYVVAYITFFDNELKQEIVEAASEIDAIHKSKFWNNDYQEWVHDFLTEQDRLPVLQDYKVFYFDCDSMINVIQI